MSDENQQIAMAIEALRELLFAGAAFRTAVAGHFGTGLREFEAISLLESTAPMTAGELARALDLTPGTVTNLLDRLEASGLAYRRSDQTDQRRVTVIVTERARTVAAAVRSWLALCLDLVPDRRAAADTFTVVGYGLRSIGEELRDGNSSALPTDRLSIATPGQAEALHAALDRAGLVLRLSHALAQERDEAVIAATVSTLLRAHLDALFVGVALVDSDRRTLRYVSLDPLPADTRRRFASFALDDTYPAGAAAATGRAYIHPSMAAAEAEFPGIRAHMITAKLASMAHLPLIAGADVIGTLAVAWSRPREIDLDDQGLLTVVAGYAAQALRRV